MKELINTKCNNNEKQYKASDIPVVSVYLKASANTYLDGQEFQTKSGLPTLSLHRKEQQRIVEYDAQTNSRNILKLPEALMYNVQRSGANTQFNISSWRRSFLYFVFASHIENTRDKTVYRLLPKEKKQQYNNRFKRFWKIGSFSAR